MKTRVVLPVQFRDIDRMGHVNHAVYLQYMETARVELAKKLRMIYDVSSSGFIVAMAHCEYKKPIPKEPNVTVPRWGTRIRRPIMGPRLHDRIRKDRACERTNHPGGLQLHQTIHNQNI